VARAYRLENLKLGFVCITDLLYLQREKQGCLICSKEGTHEVPQGAL
jgi:hypothetical protein